MVDESVGQDANDEQSGPSEETKAEQRRTAKERQRRIEATKAALQAEVVSAKLDATDRLLRAALTAQAEGETEKVQEAIREHEFAAQSIATQAAWREQVDSMLDDADLDWSDEELAGARVKQEAGDLAGALREVEKAAGPTQQSAEERAAVVQTEVRKTLVEMGLKVDDGGASSGTSTKEFTPVAVADLVSDPKAGKESVDEFLTAFYEKVNKRS